MKSFLEKFELVFESSVGYEFSWDPGVGKDIPGKRGDVQKGLAVGTDWRIR